MKSLAVIAVTALFTSITVTDFALAAQESFEIDVKELRRPAQSGAATPDRRVAPRKVSRPATASPEADTAHATSYSTYTVRPGDHLHLILARHFHLSDKAAEQLIPEIVRLNNISNPKALTVGQRLKIPLPAVLKKNPVRSAKVPVSVSGPDSSPSPLSVPQPTIPAPTKTLVREVTVPMSHPCTLTRSVVEQLGYLAPDVNMLASEGAFAAACGDRKLVVACGLSVDETYTYQRMLALSDVGLLVFKGDEPANRVMDELAGHLKLDAQIVTPDAHFNLPLTYLFLQDGPDRREVRLTIMKAVVPETKLAVIEKTEEEKPLPDKPDLPLPAAPIAPETPVEPLPNVVESAPVISPLRLPAAENTPENIWDLYLLAKANDPALGRSNARLSGSRADTDIVKSALFPQVVAGAGITQIDHTLVDPPNPTTSSSVVGYNYSVSATVPLVNVPTHYNLSAAGASLRGEEAAVLAAGQNLIVRFTDACFSILKARQDQKIALDEISRLKQALEQSQAFLKAGTGDIIAVYEAKARLDSVVADLNRAESTLRLAEQKLSSIVGKPVISVADPVQLQPKGPEPDDLDWWLATMEKQDPVLRQAREGRAQAEEQLKAAKAEYYPILQASGGYFNNRGGAYKPDIETRQWTVGANISFPLYSGGGTSARIQRAASNESERRFMLDETREQRRENVKQSFFNLRYNYSLLKALEQKKASAEIQLNAVKKGRSIGTRSAIDLLNAEQAYSVALRDLTNTLYDNVLRTVQLNYAAGTLKDEDLQAISRAPGP